MYNYVMRRLGVLYHVNPDNRQDTYYRAHPSTHFGFMSFLDIKPEQCLIFKTGLLSLDFFEKE